MADKILIIDDEKDMRVYLTTLFKKAGYIVETAENGHAGIEKARISPPDLITLDILMPKKSGLRTYRELRNAPETSKIPIVILTGLAQKTDFFPDELASLPAPNAVCEKPIDRKEFLECVSEVLSDRDQE